MSTNQLEELENIRRVAERGRKSAYSESHNIHCPSTVFVDLFQHILDLVEQIKVNNK